MEISYSLIEVDSGKQIAKKNESNSHSLASVSKLYTTYYVLNNTDNNKSFTTSILIDGEIKNHQLEGDLYLSSKGDPYLTINDSLSLIEQIKAKGIQQVNGQFFIVNSIGWEMDSISDLGLEDQADNAAIGSLNIEFNRFRYLKKFGEFHPPLDYIELKELPGSGKGLKFKALKRTNKKEAWGVYKKEKKKYTEEVPVKDSELYGGHLFKYLAGLHNLKLPIPKKTDTEKGKSIATHEGLPLYRLAQLCIEYSNNLIAEMLLYAATNEPPKKGAQKMSSWYKGQFPNINWKPMNLHNGSGLNLTNQTSANSLASWLAKISNQVISGRSFKSYLSINGHSGGLRKRLKDPEYAYKVYGKTGSLFFVNNLAGYLIGNSGKHYAFAIFTSDQKNRSILNGKNSEKVNRVRQKASSWGHQSKNQIDSLLKSWINTF